MKITDLPELYEQLFLSASDFFSMVPPRPCLGFFELTPLCSSRGERTGDRLLALTMRKDPKGVCATFFCFFFTLVTGPIRPWNLKLSDTRVYEPQTRARLVGSYTFDAQACDGQTVGRGRGPLPPSLSRTCFQTCSKPGWLATVRASL